MRRAAAPGRALDARPLAAGANGSLFSILIDESCDISIVEQMVVIVRLVDVCLKSQ